MLKLLNPRAILNKEALSVGSELTAAGTVADFHGIPF
jgi:hypothetical protein